MKAILMQKRTIGLVAGSVAALVLIGGTAADARSLITGKEIKDNSVTGKDIKNGSLTLSDFKASERAKLRGPAGTSASLNTVTVESPTVTVAAGDIGTVIAYCPAGKKVTGGGYYSSIAIAASSQPGGTFWGAVINNYANAIDVEVNAYAVCV
jgi:hypothetical protein